MPLVPGTHIGGYEIVAPIGAGGMGEVYRARDTKLQRDVAIKILPAAIAGDADRAARFAREAQVLAALNHPGIAQIYGFEESRALAMELVEGDDLAVRLGRGPVPLDEALAIVRQIAEALEYAHERGIIHRDLKPSNVKLTPNGVVKVLDFGLAKAVESHGAASGAAMSMLTSPTFTSPAMTEMGVILGTAAYMAPEQAKGKPVDRRADIWALGVVFFEMLAGRAIYTGETVTDTIAQVITQPPDWSALPAATPAAVRRILRRCLEKDPNKRFQSAGDLRIEIEEYFVSPAGETPAAAGAHPRTLARRIPWAVAVALAIALAFVSWRAWSRPAPSAPLMRINARLGAGEHIAVDPNVDGAAAVLSPDGRTLVYAAVRGSDRLLHARALDSLESKPLAGTGNATSHFFSPDGQWVGFFSGGALKKIAIGGGAPVMIAPAGDLRGGTWGPDDTIVFTSHTVGGLKRVSASGGGTPVELTTTAKDERSHRWPSFLPDGSAVLFIRQHNDASYDDGVIEAVRLDTRERKVILRGGTFPRYLASGHLVFMRENTLFGVPFDAKRLEVRGTPQPIGHGVLASIGTGAGGGNGAAQIAFSENGTAVYIGGSGIVIESRLAVVDRHGKQLFVASELRDYRDPRFSPDGRRVAVQVNDGRATHVHVIDVETGVMTRVTFDGMVNGMPVWSPDGKQLAYFSDRGGKGIGIYITRSDGAGEPQPIAEGPGFAAPTSFSPDGKWLIGFQQRRGVLGLIAISLADRKVAPFGNPRANEIAPFFSPDGKWVAYSSDESGRYEVYVRPFPGPGGKWQVSSEGGAVAGWTKGGRELVFLNFPVGTSVMTVPVTVEGDAFKAGRPEKLLDLEVARPGTSLWMHASADGGRLVYLKATDGSRADGYDHVTLVFNYFDEVRRILASARQ